MKKLACTYTWNPFFEEPRAPRYRSELDDALDFHRGLECYRPTPLLDLRELASSLGLGRVLVKDESSRFGLKAFKVLGASYGIHRFLQAEAEEGEPASEKRLIGVPRKYTFATATDGNHGRAVAWSARGLGHRAVIYVPANVSRGRVEAIRAEGAQVVVVDGIYDDAVRAAARDSQVNGWQVISDHAYEGYTEIPGWIMDGYATIFFEINDQLREEGLKQPDTLFLQAGVGGLACGAVRYLERFSPFPAVVVVEPLEAAGLLASIRSPGGEIRSASGTIQSWMSGLNSASPSVAAWPLLRKRVQAFVGVNDGFGIQALRLFHHPGGSDPRVISGESGAAGLAGLLSVCRERELHPLREQLGLNSRSAVLLINTEGDTDPEILRKILHRG